MPEPIAAVPAPARVAAIVGRPNVGKSALFNRLAGQGIAIVHDQPGITRDRLAAECRLGSGAPFEILDTGGIGADVDGDFSARVRAEAEIAIATAAVILFVVDGRAGLTPVDLDLAARLRRARGKPVLLVINKIDQPELDAHTALAADFARLGFAETYLVSAAHGRGINPLVAAVERHLPKAELRIADRGVRNNGDPPEASSESSAADYSAIRNPQSAIPRLALLGRPNVGKSSLVNALLGEQRTIVSEIAGTTRDAVDIPCTLDGQPYVLIDTAGLRHRGKRDNSAEIFSAIRSENSVKRADLCVLVLDASAGVTAQDRQIAGLIQQANKPCLVAVNKWDLLNSPEAGPDSSLAPEIRGRQAGGKKRQAGREAHAFREAWLERTRAELFFLPHVPFVTLSALRGEDLPRLLAALEAVRAAAGKKLGTGPLNRALQTALATQPPPLVANQRFKLLYATQIANEGKTAPPVPVPTFLLFINNPGLLTDTYRRYLENRIREIEPFPGLPIRFKLRGRDKDDSPRSAGSANPR